MATEERLRTIASIVGIAVAAFACKTRGTITLDFDQAIPCDAAPDDGHPVDAGPDASVDAAEYVVVYAKDRTTCSDCNCGACFGRQTASASACADATDRCTSTAFATPASRWICRRESGQWCSTGTVLDDILFANRCIDVTVDSDRTSNSRGTHDLRAACSP
jgi:hypothetical protein